MITRPVLVKGHRLRDEFACPITRELMRDPVIAADGHTYDREAIEMWLRNHDTSPKAGGPMDHLFLVPNHNLKRLIRDLIMEGGEALYIKEEDAEDASDNRFRFALVPEHVLILKCLGPVESDWNGKTFRVTQRGCIGGRKMPADLKGADFMHFTDATVSRSHFAMFFDSADECFKIKDEGSAGGTFVRIPFAAPKPLYPGLMIMLGKHQMLVREATATAASASSAAASSSSKSMQQCSEAVPADLEGTRYLGADAKEGATRRSRPTTPVYTQAGATSRNSGEGKALADGSMEYIDSMDASASASPHEEEGGADDDSVPDTSCPPAPADSKEKAAEDAPDTAKSSVATYKVRQ